VAKKRTRAHPQLSVGDRALTDAVRAIGELLRLRGFTPDAEESHAIAMFGIMALHLDSLAAENLGYTTTRRRAMTAALGGGRKDAGDGMRIRQCATALGQIIMLLPALDSTHASNRAKWTQNVAGQILGAIDPKLAVDMDAALRIIAELRAKRIALSGAVADLMIVAGAFGTSKRAERSDVQRRVESALKRVTR
jgi:hypothetical protein